MMNNTYTASVALGFEAAHRLPETTGPCRHLHGHSWTAILFIAGPDRSALDAVMDRGVIRHLMSEWVGRHLDHVCMLGVTDPLIGALSAHEERLFVFGESTTPGLAWPTAEAVAELLYRQTAGLLRDLAEIEREALALGAPPAPERWTAGTLRVDGVRVRDTAANSVTFNGYDRDVTLAAT